jgi:hypothetical protein
VRVYFEVGNAMLVLDPGADRQQKRFAQVLWESAEVGALRLLLQVLSKVSFRSIRVLRPATWKQICFRYG